MRLLQTPALTQLTNHAEASGTELNGVGMTIMIVSIASILTLLIYCYSRILRKRPESSD
jgi:hypothetical protein